MSTRCCCRPSEPCPPRAPAVAARRFRRNRNTISRLAHARHVSCRLRWAGVDAPESQTLARAPGPRGANGTCASRWRRNERTKHTLHAPLHYLYFGEKRRAREGRDERPMNASPKLIRYIRRYSCCKIGHTAPPRLCCATICERKRI